MNDSRPGLFLAPWARAVFHSFLFPAALFTLLTVPPVHVLAPEHGRPKSRETDVRPSKDALITGADLLRGGLPTGLVQFAVPDPTGRYLGVPRLAVLRNNRLEIFRPLDEGGETLQREFSIDEMKKPVLWQELVSFPSGYDFPGVVIYGGGETTRENTTVVCYVQGKFKIVFQGNMADFVDLNHDGYPEILEEHYANQDARAPDTIVVWAWNGQKYVVAIKVPDKEFCSRQVLEAVRRVAAARM